MFHPNKSGSSGPLWLGDWKYMYQLAVVTLVPIDKRHIA